MKLSYAYRSETGPRSENQDAAVVLELGHVLVAAVADGLGGHNGGSVASRVAVEILEQRFLVEFGSLDLQQLAASVHDQLGTLQSMDPALREMATTFTAALFDNDQLRYVHCGDTRLVVQRGSGIRRLTTDHTEAQRLLDAGLLTAEEFERYPRKNILTSALGIKGAPQIDAGEITLQRGDRVFIMSDGVYGALPLRTLKRVSDDHSSPDGMVGELVREVENLGPDDNYSIVAVFCH